MSGIRNYQNWKWHVPRSDGTIDQVELFLGVLGRETISVNDVKVSDQYAFRPRKSYLVPLSDDKNAELEIRADWKNLGFPECMLTVDGVLIPVLAGGEQVQFPITVAPSLRWRLWTVVNAVYERAAAGALLCLMIWVYLHSEGQTRTGARFWGIILGIGLMLQFFSLRKSVREARARGVSLVQVLYEGDSNFFKRSMGDGRKESKRILSDRRKLLSLYGFLLSVALFAIQNEMPQLIARALRIPRPLGQITLQEGLLILLPWIACMTLVSKIIRTLQFSAESGDPSQLK